MATFLLELSHFIFKYNTLDRFTIFKRKLASCYLSALLFFCVIKVCSASMLGSLKQHWNVLGKTGSTDASLPPWCIFPHRSSTTPPPAWVKNYCIWCNLMDCWTVNMLDSLTAVLPRVKCDGWAGGSRGTYGNDQAWKERVILGAFVSLTSDHTEAFVCFSFVLYWPMRDNV